MERIEKGFEWLLWNSRVFILLAVVFSMIGSMILFVVASLDVFHVLIETFKYYSGTLEGVDLHSLVIGEIILAVDLYLIAVVLFIFAFGLYELFISEIDIAKKGGSSKVLEITSLDQLKDKLAKVIVMVLVVSFFNKVLNMSVKTPEDMLFFAGSILALSLGLYFLNKDPKAKKEVKE
jgi:uncharacterized membrane protein YqhA